MRIMKKWMLVICAALAMQESYAQFVFDTIPSPDPQSVTYITTVGRSSVFIDNIGNIVAATSDAPFGLKKYNHTSWYAPDSAEAIRYKLAGISNGYPSYPFDKENNMWGGSDSVLVKVNDTSTTTFRIPFYQSPSFIYNLCIDDSDHVWALMSIYDQTNTTQNSSISLVKFDGTNWSKYRIIDYDTSGRFIYGQSIPRIAPSAMYYKNGRIYMLNEYGSSGYFDGQHFTFSKYGWGDDISGQVIGITKQGITLVARLNSVMAYDPNDSLLFTENMPSSVNYPSIFAGGGIQQMDSNGTYWFQDLNPPIFNTIYYYNPFTHIGGKIDLPQYMGLYTQGYYYLQSINYNPVRNKLLLSSTVNSSNLTNARPNTRFMELDLTAFYHYLATTDTVWPGDANADHMVDNTDLLPIGLGYDSTGPVRIVQGIVWQGDVANNWSNYFSIYAPTVNFNHADCDGNGTINAADTSAILLNFGDVHTKTNAYNNNWRSGTPGLTVKLYNDTTYAGDTLTAKFFLGDSTTPVSNIYGLAFTYNYDPIVMDSTTFTFAFIPSWLGTPANSINIQKNFATAGVLKVAITGIDHLPRSGSGQIATSRGIITTDNINAKDYSYYLNSAYISDITAIDQLGHPVPLNAGIDSNKVGYYPNGIREPAAAAKVSIYPNPAATQIRVSTDINITGIQITNMLGQQVLTETVSNRKTEIIDISSLAAGVYTVQIACGNSAGVAKLVVSR